MTMRPVPDPRGCAPNSLEKVAEAFRLIKRRSAMQFLSEKRMRRMALQEAAD